MRHLPGIVAAALLVGGGIAQAAPVVPVHGVYETEAGAEHTLYAVAREDEEAARWMADGRRVVHVLVTHETDSLNWGTTSHYFAFNPETLRKRKQLRVDALRFAPQGGYIHIDDKVFIYLTTRRQIYKHRKDRLETRPATVGRSVDHLRDVVPVRHVVNGDREAQIASWALSEETALSVDSMSSRVVE